MKDFKAYLQKQLKDPEFAKEYQALEPEFSLIKSIIETRLNKGLTQVELAKKAGLHQSAIARLEAGKNSPTLQTYLKVAKAVDKKLSLV